MYLYVRISAWDILTKKRKQHPSPGYDASTAEAAPRVGRGEQGETRRAHRTPNGGTNLDSLTGFVSPFALSSFASFHFVCLTSLLFLIFLSTSSFGFGSLSFFVFSLSGYLGYWRMYAVLAIPSTMAWH